MNKIKELYQNLKEEILNLGDIDIEYKKFYIAFKGNTNIVDIEVYSSKIKLFIFNFISLYILSFTNFVFIINNLLFFMLFFKLLFFLS